MSECSRQIHRALQSYDDGDLGSYISHLADAARTSHQTVETVIIDLKAAVNALPTSSLRDHGRRELRDSVVRMALRAYYDGLNPIPTRLAWR